MMFLIPAFVSIGLVTGPADSGAAGCARPIDFSREVRPILSNYGFPCHGPDEKVRKAKLRFDVSQAAVAELPSGNRAIDRFILARLDREGLRPSAPSDRYALLRQVSPDLTGLPPSPGDIDRFVNDPSPDAYERAVDALLARPAFGERWAAVWPEILA